MTAPIRTTPETIDGRFEMYRVVLDYEGLHEGFVDRVEDLNVPRGEIDLAGKFTAGHASKILCSPPIKILGKESLGKMLKATGMALVLVIDDERFAPVKARMVKRKRTVPANARMVRPPWLFSKDCAREMGKKRWSGLSPAKRKRIAKRAARARWKRREIATASVKPALPPAQ